MTSLGNLVLELSADVPALASDLNLSHQLIKRSFADWQRIATKGIKWDFSSNIAVELTVAEAQLDRSLRQMKQMVKGANLSVDVGLGNLDLAGAMQTQMRATRSIFNDGMKAIESDSKGYPIRVSVEFDGSILSTIREQIQGLNGVSIVAKVDDSALTALNSHLSLKEEHLDRVVGKFASTAIMPTVDDRALTQLNQQLTVTERNLERTRPRFAQPIVTNIDSRQLQQLDDSVDRLDRPHRLKLELPDTLSSLTSAIAKLALSPISIPVKIAQSAISGVFEGFTREIGAGISDGLGARKFAKNQSRRAGNYAQTLDREIFGIEDYSAAFLSELIDSGDVRKSHQEATPYLKANKHVDRLKRAVKLGDLKKNPELMTEYPELMEVIPEDMMPAFHELGPKKFIRKHGLKPQADGTSLLDKISNRADSLSQELMPTEVVGAVVNPALATVSPILNFINKMQVARAVKHAKLEAPTIAATLPKLEEGQDGYLNVIGGAQFREGRGHQELTPAFEGVIPGRRLLGVANPETDPGGKLQKNTIGSFVQSALKTVAPDLANDPEQSNNIANVLTLLNRSLNPKFRSTATTQSIANVLAAQQTGVNPSKVGTLSYSFGGADARDTASGLQMLGLGQSKVMALAYPDVNAYKPDLPNFQAMILKQDVMGIPKTQFGLGSMDNQQVYGVDKLAFGGAAHAYKHYFKSPELTQDLSENMGMSIAGGDNPAALHHGSILSRTLHADRQINSVLDGKGFDLQAPYGGGKGEVSLSELYSQFMEGTKKQDTSNYDPTQKAIAESAAAKFSKTTERIKADLASKGVDPDILDKPGELKANIVLRGQAGGFDRAIESFKTGVPQDEKKAYFAGGLDRDVVRSRIPDAINAANHFAKELDATAPSTALVVDGFRKLAAVMQEFANNGVLSKETKSSLQKTAIEPNEYLDSLSETKLDNSKLPTHEQLRTTDRHQTTLVNEELDYRSLASQYRSAAAAESISPPHSTVESDISTGYNPLKDSHLITAQIKARKRDKPTDDSWSDNYVETQLDLSTPQQLQTPLNLKPGKRKQHQSEYVDAEFVEPPSTRFQQFNSVDSAEPLPGLEQNHSALASISTQESAIDKAGRGANAGFGAIANTLQMAENLAQSGRDATGAISELAGAAREGAGAVKELAGAVKEGAGAVVELTGAVKEASGAVKHIASAANNIAEALDAVASGIKDRFGVFADKAASDRRIGQSQNLAIEGEEITSLGLPGQMRTIQAIEGDDTEQKQIGAQGVRLALSPSDDLAKSKDYVKVVEGIFAQKKATIYQAIESGDAALAKKLNDDYKRNIAKLESEIAASVKNGDSQTKEFYNSGGIKNQLAHKKRFAKNIDVATDLIETNASPEEIKQAQIVSDANLRKLTARSIVNNRNKPAIEIQPAIDVVATPVVEVAPSRVKQTNAKVIGDMLKDRKLKIEQAIEDGDLESVKVHKQELNNLVQDGRDLIATNPNSVSLKSNLSAELTNKEKFAQSAGNIADLMGNGATANDIDSQLNTTAKLKKSAKLGLKSLLINRMGDREGGSNDAGFTKIEATIASLIAATAIPLVGAPIAAPIAIGGGLIAALKNSPFAKSRLGQTQVPGLDFLDTPVPQIVPNIRKAVGNLFSSKKQPERNQANELGDLNIQKEELQAKLESARVVQENFKKIKASQPPVGSSNEENAAYDRDRTDAWNQAYDARAQAHSDGIDLRQINRKIKAVKKSVEIKSTTPESESITSSGSNPSEQIQSLLADAQSQFSKISRSIGDRVKSSWEIQVSAAKQRIERFKISVVKAAKSIDKPKVKDDSTRLDSATTLDSASIEPIEQIQHANVELPTTTDPTKLKFTLADVRKLPSVTGHPFTEPAIEHTVAELPNASQLAPTYQELEMADRLKAMQRREERAELARNRAVQPLLPASDRLAAMNAQIQERQLQNPSISIELPAAEPSAVKFTLADVRKLPSLAISAPDSSAGLLALPPAKPPAPRLTKPLIHTPNSALPTGQTDETLKNEPQQIKAVAIVPPPPPGLKNPLLYNPATPPPPPPAPRKPLIHNPNSAFPVDGQIGQERVIVPGDTGTKSKTNFDKSVDSLGEYGSGVGKSFRSLGSQFVESGSGIAKGLIDYVGTAQDSFGKLFGLLKGGLALFGGLAILPFAAAQLANIGNQAVQAAAKFEDLKSSVSAVSNSQATASAAIATSTASANKLGYNYQSAIATDAGFKAATDATPLESIASSLPNSIREYGRVTGLSQEQQDSVQGSIQSALARGQLTSRQARELSLNTPGLEDILARSQGLNKVQLRKQIKEGEIDQNDLLPALDSQLRAETAPQLDRASQSTSARVGRLQNSVSKLQVTGGQKLLEPAGLGLDVASKSVELLTENIDTLVKIGIAGFAALTLPILATVIGIGALPPALSFAGAAFNVFTGILGITKGALLGFATTTAALYAAFEVFNIFKEGLTNTSPLAAAAAEYDKLVNSVDNLGSAYQSADEKKQALESRKDKAYGGGGLIQKTTDFAIGVVNNGLDEGHKGVTWRDKREADDIVTRDGIIDNNERLNKSQVKFKSIANQKADYDLQLSQLRAAETTLLSFDRDGITKNQEAQAKIVAARAKLTDPVTERQAKRQQQIKVNQNLIDTAVDPNSSDVASAKMAIKEAQAELTDLSKVLNQSSDRIKELGLSFKLLTGKLAESNQEIDRNATELRTKAIANFDPFNEGANTSTLKTIDQNVLGQKIGSSQVKLGEIQQQLATPENKAIADPLLKSRNTTLETVSPEQIAELQDLAKDSPEQQQVLARIQKYVALRADIDSKQAELANSQADVKKSIFESDRSIRDFYRNLAYSFQDIASTLKVAQYQAGATNIKSRLQDALSGQQGVFSTFIESMIGVSDSLSEQSKAAQAAQDAIRNNQKTYEQDILGIKDNERKRPTNVPTPIDASPKAAAADSNGVAPTVAKAAARYTNDPNGYTTSGASVQPDIQSALKRLTPAERHRYLHTSLSVDGKTDLGLDDFDRRVLGMGGGIPGVKIKKIPTTPYHPNNAPSDRAVVTAINNGTYKPTGQVSQSQAPAAPTPQLVSTAPGAEQSLGTVVNSSTYNPGGGGMNAGEIDARGRRLTNKDYAIAIPGQNRVKDQIPYGSIVSLEYKGRQVKAKVTDGGPYIPGRQMDMTTAAARALKFDGVGQVGVKLVELPKGADPDKDYYFGEATYRPKIGKGGSVSPSEARKAIGSVVQGDKFLRLNSSARMKYSVAGTLDDHPKNPSAQTQMEMAADKRDTANRAAIINRDSATEAAKAKAKLDTRRGIETVRQGAIQSSTDVRGAKEQSAGFDDLGRRMTPAEVLATELRTTRERFGTADFETKKKVEEATANLKNANESITKLDAQIANPPAGTNPEQIDALKVTRDTIAARVPQFEKNLKAIQEVRAKIPAQLKAALAETNAKYGKAEYERRVEQENSVAEQKITKLGTEGSIASTYQEKHPGDYSKGDPIALKKEKETIEAERDARNKIKEFDVRYFEGKIGAAEYDNLIAKERQNLDIRKKDIDARATNDRENYNLTLHGILVDRQKRELQGKIDLASSQATGAESYRQYHKDDYSKGDPIELKYKADSDAEKQRHTAALEDIYVRSQRNKTPEEQVATEREKLDAIALNKQNNENIGQNRTNARNVQNLETFGRTATVSNLRADRYERENGLAGTFQGDALRRETRQAEIKLKVDSGEMPLAQYEEEFKKIIDETDTLKNKLSPLKETFANVFGEVEMGSRSVGDGIKLLFKGVVDSILGMVNQVLSQQLFNMLTRGLKDISANNPNANGDPSKAGEGTSSANGGVGAFILNGVGKAFGNNSGTSGDRINQSGAGGYGGTINSVGMSLQQPLFGDVAAPANPTQPSYQAPVQVPQIEQPRPESSPHYIGGDSSFFTPGLFKLNESFDIPPMPKSAEEGREYLNQPSTTQNSLTSLGELKANNLDISTMQVSNLAVTNSNLGKSSDADKADLGIIQAGELSPSLINPNGAFDFSGITKDMLGKQNTAAKPDVGGGGIGGSLVSMALPFIGKLFGFSEGGLVGEDGKEMAYDKYAEGGLIAPGQGRSTADDQLILAQKGEGIITHKGMDLLGGDRLKAINKGMLPVFATGGVIGDVSSSAATPVSAAALTPSPVIQGMTSPIQGEIQSGHNVEVNVNIANNGQTQTTSKGDGKAFGDAIAVLVSQQIVKEKRPGGLLY